MAGLISLGDAEWRRAADQLTARGWIRLARAVHPGALAALEAAAPHRWTSLPESEGSAGVRQAGMTANREVGEQADAVEAFAREIEAGISGATNGLDPLPTFNHAQWGRPERGRQFITPHRDPATAGGVIAVLTLRGMAVFRIWDFEGSSGDARRHPETMTSWETEDGDLVLMTGGGWPLPTSRCPVHEAQSPLDGDRVTLTLRHNKGGFAADYF